eukprot:TRINITY_DN838_c1_g2_i1.p1 TRINITY_DN838_c1_g2~~TRINITY_DN838_c1_g2_i1.p1  ORF type:complete len:224 (+),score=38.69 TRINITY_DN838_c1_g2_i1:376-1047(+)
MLRKSSPTDNEKLVKEFGLGDALLESMVLDVLNGRARAARERAASTGYSAYLRLFESCYGVPESELNRNSGPLPARRIDKSFLQRIFSSTHSYNAYQERREVVLDAEKQRRLDAKIRELEEQAGVEFRRRGEKRPLSLLDKSRRPSPDRLPPFRRSASTVDPAALPPIGRGGSAAAAAAASAPAKRKRPQIQEKARQACNQEEKVQISHPSATRFKRITLGES